MQSGPKEPGYVDWHVRAPNNALLGNGYTRAEALLTHSFALGLTIFALTYWWSIDSSPKLWQAALIAVAAYDLLGGVVANNLNSCKRFYHAAEVPGASAFLRATRYPLLFTALHFHTVIFAFAFGYPPSTGIVWYIVLWTSVAVVTRTPLYLRRPLAAGITVAAILLGQTVLRLPQGLGWVIASLFLKLVVGHSVQEEPYRPRPLETIEPASEGSSK